MRYFIFPLAFLALTVSCNKEPGRGGTSSITGKVLVYNINSLGDTTAQYYGMDEDVFIVYGDKDLTYDDKFACSYDGSYRFDYLTPGEYTLYSYSRCDTCEDGMIPVFRKVQIQDKKTVYEVSDLIILK
jgi:hypothetical protein